MLVSDGDGYYAASLSYTYQVIEDSHWRKFAGITMTRAELDDPNSGQTEIVQSYLIIDAADTELASWYESVFVIASGGDGSITDKDRCNAKADNIKAEMLAVSGMVNGGCKTILPPGKLTIDLELGIGAKYESNQEICQNATNITPGAAEAARTRYLSACYERNGLEYIPADIEVVIEAANPEQLTLTGETRNSCPSGHSQTNTLASTDGTIVCTSEAFYSCSWKAPAGKTEATCVCDKISEGDTICTDIDPDRE
jgi:hypothetical protein